MNALQQFIGYNKNINENTNCLVTSVINEMVPDIKKTLKVTPDIGSWVITKGDCENIEMFGPFETMEESFTYAKDNLGIIKFMFLES